MILTDTGPLVALFNRTDAAHGSCVDTLKDIDEPIATTLPVLTEAFHLLGPAGDGAATVTSPSTSSGKQALTLFWRPLLSL